MSWIYQKEIVDGIRRSRKILGVPIYQRTDNEDGSIKRKYLLGLWKTVTTREWKKYCFCGITIRKKKQTVSVSEYYTLLAELKTVINESKELLKLKENISYIENMGDRSYLESKTAINQSKELLKLREDINYIKDRVNRSYAESANIRNLIQCQELHKKTFGAYKNSFAGKEVVLVASGPTAQYFKGIEGAIYVGVNNACLLENVKLDYLFCQDFYMNDEKRQKIVKYRNGECKKFFGRIPDNRMEASRVTKAAEHVRRCLKCFVEEPILKYYIGLDQINHGNELKF